MGVWGFANFFMNVSAVIRASGRIFFHCEAESGSGDVILVRWYRAM